MKKTVVILLLLIYGSATMGATVHLHYCMNEFVSWSLFHGKKDKCGKCGMEEKDNNGCCKDEHKFIKNNSDQKTAQSVFQLMKLIAVAIPVSFVEIPPVNFPSVTEKNPLSHAPPRSCGAAVYIRNCVFLI